MKALVVIVVFLAFMWWRNERFDAHDREHRFGAYADLAPRART